MENFKRIDLDQNEQHRNQYDLFAESNQQSCETSITAFQELTPLSKKFFCKENLDKIQKQIQERIFIHHQFKIGRQNDIQLNIIKRSIYLQHSKNLKQNIDKQIQQLNEMVITEALKSIVPNILQHLHYIKDISQDRKIMSHSMNVSSAGDKSLGGFNFT